MQPKALEPGPMRRRLGPLLLLAGIFYITFVGRVAMAPLLPNLEADLGLSHAQAGGLFLAMAVGYFVAVFAAGFVSQRITYWRTILLASLAMGLVLLCAPLVTGRWSMNLLCLALGLAAGLYLPSGVAALTSFVRPADWGKAIAVHELAPSGALMSAPLIAELFLDGLSWWGIMALVGAFSVGLGLVYARWGRGGEFPGHPPNFAALGELLRLPAVWLLILFFAMGVGASLGVYTMLPLYLITEKGFDQASANLLVGLSRLPGLGMAFVAGWAHDRFGPRASLVVVYLAIGLATLGLGLGSGGALVAAVFIMPTVAVCFFPVGFAALSAVAPPHLRGVAVSLTTPLAFVLGGGLLPTFIGWMGEQYSFGAGVTVSGLIFLSGAGLALLLPRGRNQVG
ncbi:MAG: MFS transporter [Desulfarculaceae bacterium]|nr:MFS transporter [Desulfarculaceae bacterium]MCF8072636.1 MFS transporter [Desulfarculaceae bacterium]MCF8102515.1 MFS transporter [Desulfarculaceae bacterium]MCF8117982.1 MFS transporter [Desulfarculaceae bacterium]